MTGLALKKSVKNTNNKKQERTKRKMYTEKNAALKIITKNV